MLSTPLAVASNKNEQMKRDSIGLNSEPEPEKRDSKPVSLPTIGSVRVLQYYSSFFFGVLTLFFCSGNFMANSEIRVIRATVVQRSSVLKNQAAKVNSGIKEQKSSKDVLNLGSPNRKSRQSLVSRQSKQTLGARQSVGPNSRQSIGEG